MCRRPQLIQERCCNSIVVPFLSASMDRSTAGVDPYWRLHSRCLCGAHVHQAQQVSAALSGARRFVWTDARHSLRILAFES